MPFEYCINMYSTDLPLASGLWRQTATKALGASVLDQVLGIANLDIAHIQEGRHQTDLKPSEMYAMIETMPPLFEGEAMAMKVLAKEAYKAQNKSRVDDVLADHVGISRGTLRNIREIYGAYYAHRDRYAAIAQAMEQAPRIDRAKRRSNL